MEQLRETIRRILKEDSKQEILDFIDKFGISRAVSFFGDFEIIKNVLGDISNLSRENKIKFIKDIVNEYNGGISVFDLNEDPILYNKMSHMYKEIHFFGENRVTVHVWEVVGDKDELGSYRVKYESLNDEIIDNIFKILMKSLEKNYN